MSTKRPIPGGDRLLADIAAYLSAHYIPQERTLRRAARPAPRRICEESVEQALPLPCYGLPSQLEDTVCQQAPNLADVLRDLDESFSEALLRLIDEKGMTDAQCYKKANVDRKLFSKIRGDSLYRPSKPTAISFAIALELTLEEAEGFLKKAGFALSHSSKFDVIVEYFIVHRIYDIQKINDALYSFDQNLLGQ